jgi:hypothetical protein
MSVNNISETILIRENTLLPAGLTVKSEVFLPGWKIIKNLDGYGLGRKIAEANWHFFYLAGDIGAIALGRLGPGSLRRAVKHALAKNREEKSSTPWRLRRPCRNGSSAFPSRALRSIFAISSKVSAWTLQMILTLS